MTSLSDQLKTSRELNEAYKKEIAELRLTLNASRESVTDLKKQRDEALLQFADLKMRLVSAERANEFMRGYLARVREDDTTQDPLVVVGDPDGEQTKVTQRKLFGEFPRPDDFTYPAHNDAGMGASSYRHDEERRRRAKHWVNY